METAVKTTERQYYGAVKAWLETLLRERFAAVHVELTADRKFSNTLKAQIDYGRDLVSFLFFLKQAAPDLTGFVKKDSASSREFVVVDVKNRSLKLDDVYQVRKTTFDGAVGLAWPFVPRQHV